MTQQAYGVQLDDRVHLSDWGIWVHVDKDVTCGAREGAGGKAGWGARLGAAICKDHVAIH